MNHVKISCFAGKVVPLLLVAAASIHAQIYTYGSVHYDWNPNYQTTIQEVKLCNVSIDVTPCGSYLKITENAVIQSVAAAEGYLRTWIQGTLNLPEKSTITNFAVTSDTTTYEAYLQPTAPLNADIDTTRGTLIASITPGPQQSYWTSDMYGNWIETTRSGFIMTIDTAAHGSVYNVLLTYLVPNTGLPNATYDLEVLHHCNNQKPGIFEFTFNADSTATPYTLTVNNMNFQLKNKQSVQIPYQKNFRISTKVTAPTTMHLTEFPDSSWSGKYLLLNTTIPDTVMQTLSKPIEMVVLWRWNKPNSFSCRYKDNYNDYRSTTQYGYQAQQQSSSIQSLIKEFTIAGGKAGLIHSIQKKKPEVFPLCRANSSAYAKMESYMAQFNEYYFDNSEFFYEDDGSTQPNPGDTAYTDTSSREFITAMKITHGLYSNDEGVLKHLIILSCGPITPSRDMITLEEIDSLLSGITVDCGNAAWTDVNFADVKLRSREDSLIDYANFKLPEFTPRSLMLSVVSESKEYSFPLSPSQQSFSIIAKASGDWQPELLWTGYDVSGKIMGSAISSVNVVQSEKDTGLVKLWAASNERLNDVPESNIDRNYGVVSESYSLKIFTGYKKYGNDLPTYASVEYIYAPNDRIVGNTTTAPADKTAYAAAHKNLVCTWTIGGLRIVLPGNETIGRIRIFSLSGKLLLEIDPERFGSAEGYFIPGGFLRQHITAKSAVVMQIRGIKGSWNRQLFMQ